ncbi:4-hydroxy-tetrahydrodipicolinate synthase [Butyricimonas sp. Marseille-P3923]|uniref:4-hydroxy-tetrahydrodipicolinate synthase n=1 Tax=Butyricimonas sp. Marseille-P3923 TaxID=1987504 RepID=UPI000C08C07F|nr:4-hydroxy-tetrahydrodipicolinate synthase [Butyricimonas sp. Marseille-P3923]
MKKFSGVGVALVTPFDEMGNIDESSLRNLVNYVMDGGVDYLVALGTTSEAATMTVEERAYVVNVITEENAGRLPIVLGVGGNNTAHVVEELATLPYLRQGDAILSVTPYYNKPSQQGLYNHFKAIAEHSPLPVILYNVPGRTSVNMTAATTLRLALDFENIIAIKEAAGNFEQATSIIAGMPENFIFLSGDDGIALPLISIGGSGVISVIANVLPYDFSTMVHLALEGEFGEAKDIHLHLGEMFKALFEEGNPAGVKAALHAKGVIASQKLRSPLCEVSDALYQKLKRGV